MNGEYEYPGLKLMLCRLEDGMVKQVFVDG
jgi:hypothetical protein